MMIHKGILAILAVAVSQTALAVTPDEIKANLQRDMAEAERRHEVRRAAEARSDRGCLPSGAVNNGGVAYGEIRNESVGLDAYEDFVYVRMGISSAAMRAPRSGYSIIAATDNGRVMDLTGRAQGAMPIVMERLRSGYEVRESLSKLCSWAGSGEQIRFFAGYGVLDGNAIKRLEARMLLARNPDIDPDSIKNAELREMAKASLALSKEKIRRVTSPEAMHDFERHEAYMNSLENKTCWMVATYSCPNVATGN